MGMELPNIFALGEDAFNNSYDQQKKSRQDRASIQAGRAIGQGDFTGAAQAFGDAGLTQDATQAFQNNQSQQQRQARIQAATAYGQGNTQAAIQALGPTGDIATQGQIQQEALAKQQAQLAYTAQAATKLRQVYSASLATKGQQGATQDVLAAYDVMGPTLTSAAGATPQSLAQIRAALQQNPDAVLTALANPHKLVAHTVGDSLITTDDETGQQVGPTLQGAKFEKLGPGDTIVQTAGNPPAPGAAPQAAGAGSVTPAGAVWNSIIQQESSGRPGVTGPMTQYGQAQGEAQLLPKTAQAMAAKLGVPWRPDLMTGTSPDAAAYQLQLGKAYFQEGLDKYGGDPAKAAMYYYGGPDEAQWGPKTHAYAQQVLARAQAASGGQPATLQGGAGSDTVATAPGVRVVAQGPMAQSMAASNANPDLHGADFLATLPPSMRGTVKAMAEGRMAVPGGAALRSPQTQALLQAVSQYDPTFDAVNYNARAKTRADFTSGKSAQTLTAFNTALAHLSNLDQAATNLENTGFPLNNQAAHWIAGVTGTDARISRFDAVKRAALDEVNKALVGGGGALADREALMHNLNAASSPATLHAAIAELGDLLEGKIQAMGQQYTQGMGTDQIPLQLITPAAQTTLNRLRGLKVTGPNASAAGWSIKPVG